MTRPLGPGRRPRPVYRDLIEYYRRAGEAELSARTQARRRWVEQIGMTFGVEGEKRRFSVDLVPRLISPHEWQTLSEGLIQRARAIEAVPGRRLRRATDPGRRRAAAASMSTAAPGWRDEATRLPAGTVRAPIMGFDLVRNEFGGWRVLEDNVRNPSGAAYAIAIRDLMDDVLPDLPRPKGLLDPANALPRLRECLLAHAGPDGTAALLSERPGAAAWFEHRLLAERAGLALTVADDLMIAEGEVRHRDTGARIDALYLRLDGELVDLTNSAGHPIGAEIFELAVAGEVFLANAPGNGVADDKAMYCNVPELIGYYLDEHPTLESVPTYRTSDEAEARIVLDRVGELVTKPVDGHGGIGVLIGPRLVRGRGGRATVGDRRGPGRLGRPGGGRAVLAPDAVRDAGCSLGTSTCERSSTCRAPGRGLHPGRPGA